MTAVVPGPGLLPSGTPTIASPAPTAERSSAVSEQLSSAGGVRADDPSGIGVFLTPAHFDGDATGDDVGQSGVPRILADLGTPTRERA